MQPKNDARWISHLSLSVTSGPNLIYGNGKQQVEITVQVTPKKNELTDEQFESIRLVTLDDDGVFRELTGNFSVSTTRDNTFRYFQSSHAAASLTYPPVTSPQRRKRFYVSSTAKSEVRCTIYAAINKDNDSTYITHEGNFLSAVEIRTVEPPRLTREDFKLWSEDAYYDTFTLENGYESGAVDIDLYHLKFKNPRHRLVKSVPLETSDGAEWNFSQLFYYKFFGAQTKHMYKHYAYTVGTNLTFNYGTFELKVSHPSTMNFVRLREYVQSSEYIPAWASYAPWLLYDQYGNSHKIILDPSSKNTFNFSVDEAYYDEP